METGLLRKPHHDEQCEEAAVEEIPGPVEGFSLSIVLILLHRMLVPEVFLNANVKSPKVSSTHGAPKQDLHNCWNYCIVFSAGQIVMGIVSNSFVFGK